MLKKYVIAFALILLNIGLFAGRDTLIMLNEEAIPSSEFEKIYKKNSKASLKGEEKSVDEYLELFINYKLKVQEAKRLRYDTSTSFNSEYNKYIYKLAEPYLDDTTLSERILREAYDRMKYAINSSHILIKSRPHHAPTDTLAAYEKALRIRESLLEGADFEKTARASSDDNSLTERGGNFGYKTVFLTRYEYETGMFNLEEGEISMPVKTSRGYHLIKVIDKFEIPGDYVIAHIMLGYKDGTLEEDRKLKAKADSIIGLLNAGAEFTKLVKEYSTDTRSIERGGVLPALDALLSIPVDFKIECWKLKNVGDYVKEPLQSKYGYHIVQLVEKRDFKPYEEMREHLLTFSEKDKDRREKMEYSMYENLMSKYNFKLNKIALNDFKAMVDTSLVLGEWKVPKGRDLSAILFSMGDKKVPVKDYAQWLERKHKYSPKIKSTDIIVDNTLKIYYEEELLKYAVKQLSKENANFGALQQEYYDGMLLFEITQDLVWDRANEDSVGLLEFYEKNKSNYLWDERAEVAFYYCKNTEVKQEVLKLVAKKSKKNYSPQDIQKIINKKDSTNLKLELKLYLQGENGVVDKMEWKAGSTSEEGETLIVEISNIRKPEPKKLSETRGYVVSDYQKYLEEKWVESLRAKSNVKIDESSLGVLKNRLNQEKK